MEGPEANGAETNGGDSKRVGSGIGQWMKGQLTRNHASPSSLNSLKRSDLRLLLGVMGAPLAPVHVTASDPLPHLSIKDTPIVISPSFSPCVFFLVLCVRALLNDMAKD